MLFVLTGGEWHVAPVGLKLTVIKGAAPLEALAVAVAVCYLTSLPVFGVAERYPSQNAAAVAGGVMVMVAAV